MSGIRPIILLIMLAGSSIGSSHVSTTSTPMPEAFVCPVTRPTNDHPEERNNPFPEDSSVRYENGIWVTIPEDGVLELTSEHEITFGPLAGWRSATITWLRDDGVNGFVIVSGERLDAASELSPQTPLSPQRQYMRVGAVTTGLAFPGEGCWQVTGTIGDHSITWVVDVRFID